MTLKEYWKALNSHDWFYYFSDDHNIQNNGDREMRQLCAIGATSPAHAELFEAFRAYIFSGKPWNKEQKQKPEEPKT